MKIDGRQSPQSGQRHKTAALVSAVFSLSWGAVAMWRWYGDSGPDAGSAQTPALLCVVFAVVAVSIWRARPGAR